jgi:hypothetical protein
VFSLFHLPVTGAGTLAQIRKKSLNIFSRSFAQPLPRGKPDKGLRPFDIVM